jgi:hypothetical protein
LDVCTHMPAGVAPRRPHARRLAANRRRRAYPQHTRERVVFCMLRGHSIKDTQAALRHDEKTVFAGLYRAPSQATCYRIRRRFRLTGLTTVEPRRGRMPLLCADETRAVRALCEKPGGKKRGYRLSRLAAWLARLVRGDVFVRVLQ